MASPADIFPCSMCSFRTGTLPEWVSHFRLVHCSDVNFDVTCNINGCKNRYQKCATFATHVYRCHRDVVLQNRKRATATTAAINFYGCYNRYYQGNSCSEQSPECEQGSRYDITLPPEDTVHQILGTDKFEQKRKSNVNLASNEVKCLSESAVKSVISSYQGMLK